eukprot:453852_1
MNGQKQQINQLYKNKMTYQIDLQTYNWIYISQISILCKLHEKFPEIYLAYFFKRLERRSGVSYSSSLSSISRLSFIVSLFDILTSRSSSISVHSIILLL